jgi:excisionase family DNA binding protein
MSEVLTVKEAAEALGFSTDTIYRRLQSGEIRGYKVVRDGDWRIERAEIERIRSGLANDRSSAA